MADETGEQLKLPEPIEASENPVNKIVKPHTDEISPLDSDRKSFPIPAGIVYRTGAYGDRYSQHGGYVPDGARVKMIDSKFVEGHRSMWVEFESPPEMKGKKVWITSMQGGKGYK